MSNQPVTPKSPSSYINPKPAGNPETTELLRRIALATEANIASLATVREEIAALLEATRTTMEASTTTAETLSKIAEAFSHQPAGPAADPATVGPTPPSDYVDFNATSIVYSTDDAGHPVYKVKGDRYQKFGVRVWDEVVPSLGIDPATLHPGPNPINLIVRCLMGETGPRKVIGKAPLF